jgi:hypothetical protein
MKTTVRLAIKANRVHMSNIGDLQTRVKLALLIFQRPDYRERERERALTGKSVSAALCTVDMYVKVQ